MALSDDRIAEMMRDTWGCASIAPRHALEFARAVEAEVRKQAGAVPLTPEQMAAGREAIYTHPIKEWEMLGTVQRGMEIGALARSPAGILAQVNAGAVRALDQRKAQAAIHATQ